LCHRLGSVGCGNKAVVAEIPQLEKALGRSIGHIEQRASEWVAKFAGFQTQSGNAPRACLVTALPRCCLNSATAESCIYENAAPTTAAISCIYLGSAVDADPALIRHGYRGAAGITGEQRGREARHAS
jgi:hypothetical protein